MRDRLLLPFALGFGMVMLLPGIWRIAGDLEIFALFMGTALSISALPVIARILLDLGLLGKNLGGIIMTAATINDVVGWSLFALILNSISANVSLGLNLGLTLGLFFLTAGMIYLNIKRGAKLPGIELAAAAMFVISAASESLGAHAVFGAFMAGIVLSLSRESRDLVLKTIYMPVMGILAPIYFVSIGMKTDFAVNFDLPIILLVLIIACTGKIVGAGIGALASGMQARESAAIGLGLNARGAMEIVLASAALDYDLIGAMAGRLSGMGSPAIGFSLNAPG